MPINSLPSSSTPLMLDNTSEQQLLSSNKTKKKSMMSIAKLMSGFTPMNGSKSPAIQETRPSEDCVSGVGKTRLNNSNVKRSLAQIIERFNKSDDLYKGITPSHPNESLAHSLRKMDNSDLKKNLTEDEFLSLNLYTTSLYRPINQHLRYGAKEDVVPVVDAMISGMNKLAKLPPFRVNQTVFRGIEKSMTNQEVQQRFQQYNIYQDSAFMSASLNEEEAESFTGPVHLEITPVSAIKAKLFSNVPREDEAIFKPNTPFFVNDVTKDRNGTWQVKLTEVDEEIASFVKNR